uniref:Nonstructural protein n=1 Tax=Peanut yellow spot virus TaxID=63443 RepID=O55842_9VIRU|nr:nonstructural protein [Peanut yellow spot virus]
MSEMNSEKGKIIIPKEYDPEYCRQALLSHGSQVEKASSLDVYTIYEKNTLAFESIHITNPKFKVSSGYGTSGYVLNKDKVDASAEDLKLHNLETSTDSQDFYDSFNGPSGVDSTISLTGPEIVITISHPKQSAYAYKHNFHGRIAVNGEAKAMISDFKEFVDVYSSNPYNFLYNPKILNIEETSSTILFPVEQIGTLPSTISVFGRYFDKNHFSVVDANKYMSVKAVSDGAKYSNQGSHRQLHNKNLKAIEIASVSGIMPNTISKTTMQTKKNCTVYIQVQVLDPSCKPEKKECLIQAKDDPYQRLVYCKSECLGQTKPGISTFLFKIICLDCTQSEVSHPTTYFAGALSTCLDLEEMPSLVRPASANLNAMVDTDREKINEIICKNLVAVHLELAQDISKKLNKPINVFTIKDTSNMTGDTVDVNGKKFRILKDSSGDCYFTSATFEKTFIGAYKSCQTFIDYCDSKKLSINGDNVFIF